jgi:beta-phosphoglucomutase
MIRSDRSIKAILFDLDGVIVDTLHYHFLAWQEVFSKIGGQVSEHTVLLHEGRSSKEILPILLHEANLDVAFDQFDEIIEKKRVYYRKIVKIRFYHGVMDLLRKLKGLGYLLVVVTACARKTMETSLNAKERELFDIIQTGDDVPRAKPNPDPYDMARMKLGLRKQECLVVENAPLGIESAKEAGLYCVAVETTLSHEYLGKADVIIEDIGKLIDLPILRAVKS